MQQAHFDLLLKLTKKTSAAADIPVAALVVSPQGEILAKGWNTRNKKRNVACHAEINAINKAIKKTRTLNLSDHRLLTTLEPCQMCFGAINQVKIKTIEYVLPNTKVGVNSIYSVNDLNLNIFKTSNQTQENSYRMLLEQFFSQLRKDQRKTEPDKITSKISPAAQAIS